MGAMRVPVVLAVAGLVTLALAPSALAQGYEDPPPTGLALNISNLSVNEGNSGMTPGAFTVSLTMAAENAVTFNWEMPAEGSATPGVDYVVASGSGSIPAGMTSTTVSVSIYADTLDEPDEGFVVHLASSTGAPISKHHGLGTIRDDDGGTIADTQPPNTMIHGGPRGTTRSRTASFHLMATEAGSKFRCKLDRGAWRPCGERKTLRRLKRGWHTFLARAVDAAGNVDPTPAKRRWRIR
jgi:hypothetical protein